MDVARQVNPHLSEILKNLGLNYPYANIALHYGSTWELLVAVMLSAQCTDKTVNVVTAKLFKKYRSIQEYARANQEEFEKDIKSTGFYRIKAKHIRETAKILIDKFHSNVPHTMEELLTLPGVARKTANIVLGTAYGILVGIPVDTHVARITQRLRLIPLSEIGGKNPVYMIENGTKNRIIDYFRSPDTKLIEEHLMKTVDHKNWGVLSYQIIEHGRIICKAANPHCLKCPLSAYCPTYRQY